nr:hypothetical protein [uncultured Halomonas sp.]
MSITDQVMSQGSPLITLMGDYKKNHVGYVYTMHFREACILTNDTWKESVAGIPHNSFLIATAINPEKASQTRDFDNEVILLRVLGPANLPSDADLLTARIEHNQRRISPEIYLNP